MTTKRKSNKPAAKPKPVKARKVSAKGSTTLAPKKTQKSQKPIIFPEPLTTKAGRTPVAEPKLTTRQRLSALAKNSRTARIFAWWTVAVLLITTVFWTILSARVQEANADQFIDAYLFENSETFNGALFPGAHSFLLKWPVFALMSLYGHQTFIFLAATLLMVLATVGILVWPLRSIEPRPVVFGLLCLALASVLLLIPAEPHPGSLLPANLAMTTTRNLEYVVFVWCAFKMLSVTTWRSRKFLLLALLMAVVIASDKLFAVLAIGSALVVLVGYVGILRRRYELTATGRWLLLGILATGIATAVLYAISRLGITNIVNESNASPFPLIHSAKQAAEGAYYAAMAFLTNFGANPVHATTVLADVPAALLRSIQSPVIVAYLVNFIILLVAVFAAIRIVMSHAQDRSSRLTVVLVAATLASLAVFVLTDHYYPADSRYITIELFALFIALASYLRRKSVRLKYVTASVIVFAIAIPVGMVGAWQEYDGSMMALQARNTSTRLVAQAIDKSHIKLLIGNYWDIVPIKAFASESVTIAPVEDCQQPRGVLSSKAWYESQKDVPTAFLAIRDRGANTYNGCSMALIATLYGTPTERVHIAKNPNPAESSNALLLLYANGVQPLKAPKPVQNETTMLSLAPRELTTIRDKATCPSVILNVVAHQDDDLLFMNPDVATDIKDGKCVRTIYLTAGDAGAPAAYWSSREQGAKGAYAEMYGVPNVWHDERELFAGHFIHVSYLEQAPRVNLVFLRLPDGDMRGKGFASTRNESLQELVAGTQSEIHTVDESVLYTKSDLISLLQGIMEIDQSDRIRSQNPNDLEDGDHSDHHAVGMLVQNASAGYKHPHELVTYVGYAVSRQSINLLEEQVTRKQLTFLAYAKFDGAVCQDSFDCQQTAYGNYLMRQYRTGMIPSAAPVVAPPAL